MGGAHYADATAFVTLIRCRFGGRGVIIPAVRIYYSNAPAALRTASSRSAAASQLK